MVVLRVWRVWRFASLEFGMGEVISKIAVKKAGKTGKEKSRKSIILWVMPRWSKGAFSSLLYLGRAVVAGSRGRASLQLGRDDQDVTSLPDLVGGRVPSWQSGSLVVRQLACLGNQHPKADEVIQYEIYQETVTSTVPSTPISTGVLGLIWQVAFITDIVIISWRLGETSLPCCILLNLS